MSSETWPPRSREQVPDVGDRMTPAECAAFLQVTVGTLRNWRAQHKGPPFYQVSRSRLFYSKLDVRAWLASRRVKPSV